MDMVATRPLRFGHSWLCHVAGGECVGGNAGNGRGFMGAPWFALFVLTSINLLNYIDRYILSALLPAIKEDLQFTDEQLGLLGSAFVFAYTFSAPFFGNLGDRWNRPRIMAVGVSLWSFATAACGFMKTFPALFCTRAVVGFGESAYSVIAPSSIADSFSKESRGKVFAIYSGALTVGSALGYVLGGLLEARVGWQKSFFVVGVPGLFMALLLFFMPDSKRGASDDAENTAPDPVKEVYLGLFKNGGFMFTVLGYAAYTFVVGGMAFWMPSYLVRYFNVSLAEANIQFGTMTVAGGLVGTLLGGALSDWIEKRSGNGFLKVAVLSMLLSAPLFRFALTMTDYHSFMVALFALEVALFLCISPLDAAVVSYVRPTWRATAMSLNVFLIHALGDGISYFTIGRLSDQFDLRSAIGFLPWVLLIAAALWAVVFIVYWQPMAWPKGAMKLPRWQAHRGYRPQDSNVVENTIEAFRRARIAGAEMCECDVQLSRDGEVVIFHDEDLKRLGGRSDRVCDLSADELYQLVQVPRLKDLLADSEAPRLINIEIKSSEFWGRSGIEAACVRLVREAQAEGRVLFSSFNPFALRRLAKIAPDIPRALLVTNEPHESNKLYLRKMWLGFWARPHLLHIDHRDLTPDKAEGFSNRGLRVVTWTVNEPERARRLIEMGVASVISDVIFTDEHAGIAAEEIRTVG